MCGIVGSWGNNRSTDWVSLKLDSIKHRGPDHQAALKIVDGPVMGVARLAMTDPHPRSNQPMSALGNHLSFNGEIYNFKNLRTQLESMGVIFNTNSDTEVVLNWLTKFGMAGIKDFEGMFSFAFFDSSEKRLLLARDTKGKKPLYFRVIEDSIEWSSEINSLVSESNQLCESGLIEYLSLGYTIDPATIREGISSVKPGEVLSITYVDTKINLNHSSYFQKKVSHLNNSSALRKAIEEAVLKRVDGHEKVALSMSGGVDSTIIACILHKHGIPVTGFSAQWKDSDKSRYNSDASIASLVAEKLSIPHRMVDMIDSKELIAELDVFLRISGEPIGNPTALSMMRLYKTISKSDIRLVLTGDGADEFLAGYSRYESVSKIHAVFPTRNKGIQEFILTNAKRLGLVKKLMFTQLAPESTASWLYWHQIFDPREIESLLIKNVRPFDTLARALELRSVCTNSKNKYGAVEALMKGDQDIWLPMESNRRLDRISMSHSVEARSPFQDDRVIDAANFLMKKEHHKKIGKKLLINEFPELLQFNLQSKKTGFSSPVGHWLRNNKEESTESILSLVESAGFDSNSLNSLVSRQWEGDYKLLMKIWTLLVLSRWLKVNGFTVENE